MSSRKDHGVEENDTVIAVPAVVQPVAVPLEAGRIAVHVRNVPVAIRMAEQYEVTAGHRCAGPPVSPLREKDPETNHYSASQCHRQAHRLRSCF
jgi:hypothetical protein